MALPDIAYMVPVVLKPLHRPPHSLADNVLARKPLSYTPNTGGTQTLSYSYFLTSSPCRRSLEHAASRDCGTARTPRQNDGLIANEISVACTMRA